MLPHHAPSSIQRLERDAGRMREIARVLTKYGLSDWLDSIHFPGFQEVLQRVEDPEMRQRTHEERIRLALTDLGTTFIKLGQILSTRSDLIGPELAAELSQLQSHTPPDPPHVVVATIEQELGRPIGELFAIFEVEAFASASVAQVHRAVLETGEIVAVKVQKEGIQTKVEADLSILQTLANLAENSSKLKDYGPARLVNEFRRTILHELDFNRERQNMETFERNFEVDETVRFPRTWRELSSRRVLTMEYMEGMLGTSIQPDAFAPKDLAEFARRGADVYLNMIFRDSFYHADPHPGNLMFLPGGVVGILDCGMVGRVDEGLRDDLESLVGAITQGDIESLTVTLWGLSKHQRPEAYDELRADLADVLADAKGQKNDLDLSATLNGILAIFRKYRITLRSGLSSLLRTLVLLDGTARRLNPRFSLSEVLGPYRDDAIKRRLSPERLLKRLQRHALEWDRLLDTLPRDINETLQKVRAGDFRVGLEHRHLDAVINRLVMGIVVSSLFLGSSLLWSLKAPPLIHDVSFFGAIGYAAALVLGAMLFRAIKKSDKSGS